MAVRPNQTGISIATQPSTTVYYVRPRLVPVLVHPDCVDLFHHTFWMCRWCIVYCRLVATPCTHVYSVSLLCLLSGRLLRRVHVLWCVQLMLVLREGVRTARLGWRILVLLLLAWRLARLNSVVPLSMDHSRLDKVRLAMDWR